MVPIGEGTWRIRRKSQTFKQVTDKHYHISYYFELDYKREMMNTFIDKYI